MAELDEFGEDDPGYPLALEDGGLCREWTDRDIDGTPIVIQDFSGSAATIQRVLTGTQYNPSIAPEFVSQAEITIDSMPVSAEERADSEVRVLASYVWESKIPDGITIKLYDPTASSADDILVARVGINAHGIKLALQPEPRMGVLSTGESLTLAGAQKRVYSTIRKLLVDRQSTFQTMERTMLIYQEPENPTPELFRSIAQADIAHVLSTIFAKKNEDPEQLQLAIRLMQGLSVAKVYGEELDAYYNQADTETLRIAETLQGMDAEDPTYWPRYAEILKHFLHALHGFDFQLPQNIFVVELYEESLRFAVHGPASERSAGSDSELELSYTPAVYNQIIPIPKTRYAYQFVPLARGMRIIQYMKSRTGYRELRNFELGTCDVNQTSSTMRNPTANFSLVPGELATVTFSSGGQTFSSAELARAA